MVDKDYDEVDDLDSAEYSNKSDLSKAEKVSIQIERCQDRRSKEMREGYYNYDKLGNRIIIPDARKEFISSVIALKTLLRPEILRQNKKKNVFDESSFVKKEEKLIEKWGVENFGNGEKIIPLLDESFPRETDTINKSKVYSGKSYRLVSGLYNSNFHRYWDDMVKLYDEMYAQLNVLIDQCNYFKQELAY